MACCALGSPLYIGADIDVEYTGAHTRDGTFLNTGTCDWELFDSDDQSLATGSLTYDPGSDGDYFGVIEATVTVDLVADSEYYVIITFEQTNNRDSRKLDTRASYRS